MEIKRTEKAFQISETQNSETSSASSKKVSTFSTSDSFENAGSNQSMFAAPQPESPLSKASESLEKQFDAIRIGQSMIGTSSAQPVSRANDKQADFTKAHAEFQGAADAAAEDALHRAAENVLSGLQNGNTSILGSDFTPLHIPLFDQPGYTEAPNTEPPNTEPSKPEPIMKFETNQRQKYFNDLLESNRLKPTSSAEDERIKNVRDHNNVPSFFPPLEPTSRANDRQTEFSEAKAEFERKLNAPDIGIDLGDFTHSNLDDLASHLADLANQKSATISESNRKQKQLTDLFASNKETLQND